MKRRKSSGKQRAELRIIVQHAGRSGLAWQATLDGDHLYAGGIRQGEHEVFRFSYHADGKTHFYTGGSRIITKRKPKLTEVVGLHKGPSWNPYVLDGAYAPKVDSAHRRTISVTADEPEIPFTVDLWFIGPDFIGDAVSEVLKEKPYIYPSAEVLGTVAADWTKPQIVAVVWRLEPQSWAKVRPQLPRVPGRADSRRSYMWVDRAGYSYDPRGGMESIKLPDQ